MPLVSASKEICNLIYIMVQVIYNFHPSSDSVVVRVMDSHAATLGSNPDFGNVILSKFPKILFLIEEQLSMLKFFMMRPSL